MPTLTFLPNGRAIGLYSEVVDLAKLGKVQTSRASHVEPLENYIGRFDLSYFEMCDLLAKAGPGRGAWVADLRPVNGPLLGPFAKRSVALAAEEEWLNTELAKGSKSSTVRMVLVAHGR